MGYATPSWLVGLAWGRERCFLCRPFASITEPVVGRTPAPFKGIDQSIRAAIRFLSMGLVVAPSEHEIWHVVPASSWIWQLLAALSPIAPLQFLRVLLSPPIVSTDLSFRFSCRSRLDPMKYCWFSREKKGSTTAFYVSTQPRLDLRWHIPPF